MAGGSLPLAVVGFESRGATPKNAALLAKSGSGARTGRPFSCRDHSGFSARIGADKPRAARAAPAGAHRLATTTSGAAPAAAPSTRAKALHVDSAPGSTVDLLAEGHLSSAARERACPQGLGEAGISFRGKGSINGNCAPIGVRTNGCRCALSARGAPELFAGTCMDSRLSVFHRPDRKCRLA